MNRRTAGMLLPVFSLRREGGLGIGDTRSLIEWIDLLSDHHVGLIQLLPINETGSDDSPYNAISSVALDPVYLDMDNVPGVDRAKVHDLSTRDHGEKVNYAFARSAKRELLEEAWRNWSSAGELHKQFTEFLDQESDWLHNYAIYRTLSDVAGTEKWEEWPSEWQEIEGAYHAVEKYSDLRSFFSWVQWLCYRQWRTVRTHADKRGVKLMGDIPIGVSRNSADVFFGRKDFDLDWCGGAPPETVFKHDAFIRKWGQNWGIPLYRWGRMKRMNYPWWRQRISKLVDVFHVFRIDHVLGFYRIYGFPWQPERNQEFLPLTKKQAKERTGGPLPKWVPRPDNTEKQCAANRNDGDHRLRMVLDAAGEGEVIGEDLGCVPDYVRPHLASLGICGFRIPHWDEDEDGKVIPGNEIPELSFATYATHDHDSIPAMWEDFRTRMHGDDEEDAKEVTETMQRLADFAGIKDFGPYDDQKQWALIDALMACNSRYTVIMITDLFSMTDRINSPGTVGDQNWTLYLPWTATDCATKPQWQRLQKSIADNKRI